MIDKPSNRYQFVDREHLHGSIQGVNFGYNLYCVARSPTAVLLWSAGTMYTSWRQSVYGASSLCVAARINPRETWHRNYREIDRGGRLRADRITAKADQLLEYFDDETIPVIANAVHARKTLLIEGGGDAFPLSSRVLKTLAEKR
jgi:hypothetical protein